MHANSFFQYFTQAYLLPTSAVFSNNPASLLIKASSSLRRDLRFPSRPSERYPFFAISISIMGKPQAFLVSFPRARALDTRRQIFSPHSPFPPLPLMCRVTFARSVMLGLQHAKDSNRFRDPTFPLANLPRRQVDPGHQIDGPARTSYRIQDLVHQTIYTKGWLQPLFLSFSLPSPLQP